jgi:hypothetical protein
MSSFHSSGMQRSHLLLLSSLHPCSIPNPASPPRPLVFRTPSFPPSSLCRLSFHPIHRQRPLLLRPVRDAGGAPRLPGRGAPARPRLPPVRQFPAESARHLQVPAPRPSHVPQNSACRPAAMMLGDKGGGRGRCSTPAICARWPFLCGDLGLSLHGGGGIVGVQQCC